MDTKSCKRYWRCSKSGFRNRRRHEPDNRHATVGGSVRLHRAADQLEAAEQQAAAHVTVAKQRLAQVEAGAKPADLAVQQIPELLRVEGIDIVGPLPAPFEALTTFSAAVLAASAQPAAARDLLEYLVSPEAKALFRQSGFQ